MTFLNLQARVRNSNIPFKRTRRVWQAYGRTVRIDTPHTDFLHPVLSHGSKPSTVRMKAGTWTRRTGNYALGRGFPMRAYCKLTGSESTRRSRLFSHHHTLWFSGFIFRLLLHFCTICHSLITSIWPHACVPSPSLARRCTAPSQYPSGTSWSPWVTIGTWMVIYNTPCFNILSALYSRW